jgi:hypothetical protein
MMSNDLEHAISESLVLAAVDRAERHRTGERTGVPIWLVLEHLEIPKRSSRARVVRARLETLGDVNALARSRRHGVPGARISRCHAPGWSHSAGALFICTCCSSSARR